MATGRAERCATQGFANVPGVVWEVLDEHAVRGDTVFCDANFQQYVPPATPADPDYNASQDNGTDFTPAGLPRCQAPTRSGKRCTREAQGDAAFCWHHLDLFLSQQQDAEGQEGSAGAAAAGAPRAMDVDAASPHTYNAGSGAAHDQDAALAWALQQEEYEKQAALIQRQEAAAAAMAARQVGSGAGGSGVGSPGSPSGSAGRRARPASAPLPGGSRQPAQRPGSGSRSAQKDEKESLCAVM